MTDDIIFQIFLVLVGALISVLATFFDKNKNKLLALGLGLALFGLTAFWAGKSTAICDCDQVISETEVTRIVPATVEVTRIVPEPTAQGAETLQKESEWVICWHGTGFEPIENSSGEPRGHEVLIAYPRSILAEGLRLDFKLFADWAGSDGPLVQDSLKMCQIDGIWYGENYWDWFAQVSFLQLTGSGFRACSDDVDGETVGCFGTVWDMLPSDSAGPEIETIKPDGTEIQVIGYVWSEGFEGP